MRELLECLLGISPSGRNPCRGNYCHLIIAACVADKSTWRQHSLVKNTVFSVPQNAGNHIVGLWNFTILWRSMPPDPQRKRINGLLFIQSVISLSSCWLLQFLLKSLGYDELVGFQEQNYQLPCWDGHCCCLFFLLTICTEIVVFFLDSLVISTLLKPTMYEFQ